MMARLPVVATFVLFALATALSTNALEVDSESYTSPQETLHTFTKRDISYKVFARLRNAHACMMSISFIVLLPLGAISLHLPIQSIPYLRDSYLVKKVVAMHAPIQSIALAMIIAAMGMGIRIAQYLNYFDRPAPYARAHTTIGLLVVSLLILFQPAMGIIQHLHYKKTGGKSIFAYAHRWLGRFLIILGMINSGLGLKLASRDRDIKTSSYIRNYALMGILVAIWFGLVVFDWLMSRRVSKEIQPSEKELTADKASSSA